ncbi:MAG: undecaprenyl/decaprenyl-phosphate alpha-N-acetylglucosaminyl 1-phosphate transferase [Candidatus Hydrogenedentota bacterium]|nr:MAG: undecaprenyl/decaprenyl-phosphate alpha-N-acetylglucosaminyl 1-phosphate transferase [Candidatus Hydrogenedentota bacterium]
MSEILMVAVAALLVSTVISAAAVPLASSLATRFGIVDRPNARKVHTVPTPMLGGLAVLLGYLVAALGAYTWAMGAHWEKFRPFQGILLGSLFIFLIGVYDDVRGVSPRGKLVGQLLAALLLIGFEIRLSLFLQQNFLTTLITILWIVGIINSFNLLDNMNGLSAGVGTIAAVTFAWIAYNQEDFLVLIIAASLAGALLGFLPYNFPKGRIFLGDGGSLLIGFVLAAVSVQGIYLAKTKLTHLPVITPVLVLGVPLFDTFSVMAIRFARGLPIFKADKNHFSHRLVDLGMTQKQAVLLIYLVSIAVSIPAVLLSHVTLNDALLLLLQEAILFFIIAALMRYGMVRAESRSLGEPEPNHSGDRSR